MADLIVRGVYRLATWAALPFVLAYFYWRGRREPAYRRYWKERLGWIGDVPARAIWIHAASVGEAILVTPLIRRLEQAYPDRAILVTTMTPTGRERIERTFADDVYCRYVPLDTLGATRRFMHRARPGLGVIAETELWPHLLAAADRYEVPIALVNASVSQRSAARYQNPLWRQTIARMLASLAAIGAASPAHAERFVALGASAERVHAIGNLKYDNIPAGADESEATALRDDWQAPDRPIWVAASTHEGEEARVLDAWAELRARHPELLLVIAPRHPQRFDSVAELLEARGIVFARRSTGQLVGDDTGVVLADTLGEVPLFYAAANVVLVGGSLVPGIEGHNVLEAAALARAFCVGPYVREWREIVDALVAAEAACVCDTPAALVATLDEWLADPDLAAAAGRAGRQLVHERSGALERSMQMIETLAHDRA
ncbi:3-deoxy-D-manno-octulosonic-acid transferase domain-containing protein [Salinisphaera sp. C84B14]|uniref:3-deoxy-D-manno-octulosonic acid transferase n=1 Tax=Salinisphaera sp. C84B14 TaxID=1304155 RepID=UPI0033429F4D